MSLTVKYVPTAVLAEAMLAIIGPDGVDACLPMNLLNGTMPSPALVRAIRRTLRPLFRLMLASGVTYPLVSELLKGVFVEAADREFRLGDKASTDRRVSLISGAHRKGTARPALNQPMCLLSE